jgi:2-iminobutanoate/2-iminopropanoate deaminase
MGRTSIYLPGPGADSTQPNLVPDAAVRGDFLFTGGVAGYDADGKLSDSPETQAERVYERIAAILKASGFTKDDIGHWFVWSPVRLSNIKAVNPKWAEWFPNQADRPARHALARELDPNMAYRIEIIGVKNVHRKSFEIKGPYHTGGSGIPHFMPFGATMGDVLFTGPTYGMDVEMTALGQTPLEQAQLCEARNQDLYDLTGHSTDNIAQMFVWFNDDGVSRDAAVKYTDVLFPNKADRPAIHYIDAKLPGGNFISGQLASGRTATEEEDKGKNWQFLIQYDIILAGNAKRRAINVPSVEVMDGASGVPAGIVAGNLAFTSVILGGRGALEAQTEKAFADAVAVIKAGGFDAADIGHAYVWYRDHSARETVDKVFAKQFSDADQRPARHCLSGKLPEGALVGVELTAAR